MTRELSHSNDRNLAFGALVLTLLANVILGATWNRMYFTRGLPIYVRRIPVNIEHTNNPSAALLRVSPTGSPCVFAGSLNSHVGDR
jgi:hypothetical protein